MAAGSNIANANTPGYSRRRAIFEAIGQGGVRVTRLERLGDKFLDVRLRQSNARLGSRQAVAKNLALLEATIADTKDSGISRAFERFFAALQDLTVQPGGTPERQAVRLQARQLLSTVDGSVRQIHQLRDQIDLQIRQEVEKVNGLTQSLAELNAQIRAQANGTTDLNHLYDQRDRLINEISTVLPVNALLDEQGAVTLLAEGGLTLVESDRAYKLIVTADGSNRGYARIGIEGISGSGTLLQKRLKEGSLAGLLETRDGDALETLNQLQRLTAELIRTFNAQHRLGTGTDNVTGRDFFTGLSVASTAAFENLGGAIASAGAIVDESLLTFDDYEIRFTAPGTYDIVNTTTGTTVSTGNAYTSGNPIVFEGISITISDGASAPSAGDVFRVDSYSKTVEGAGLSAAVQADLAAIAAGLGPEAGDNRNALALAGLREAAVLGASATMTFEQFMNAIQSKLGLAVQTARNSFEDEEIAQFQIFELNEAARGVSIDEEAADILQFQRSFEAASRVIRVTDELLQTIINMV